MSAAGAYLWEVRELRRLSRAEVAAAIREQTGEGTNEVQVLRIEKGQNTSAAVLAAFARAVQGDFEQTFSLLLDPEATTDAAREAARRMGTVMWNDGVVIFSDVPNCLLTILFTSFTM